MPTWRQELLDASMASDFLGNELTLNELCQGPGITVGTETEFIVNGIPGAVGFQWQNVTADDIPITVAVIAMAHGAHTAVLPSGVVLPRRHPRGRRRGRGIAPPPPSDHPCGGLRGRLGPESLCPFERDTFVHGPAGDGVEGVGRRADLARRGPTRARVSRRLGLLTDGGAERP
jgi:hypothetical protein